MANRARSCPMCDYRTNSASAMNAHNVKTGHHKTHVQYKYVLAGEYLKKVKVK